MVDFYEEREGGIRSNNVETSATGGRWQGIGERRSLLACYSKIYS